MNHNILYINPANKIIRSNSSQGEFIRDLKLDLVLDAIAGDDRFLRSLFKKIFLNPSIHTREIKMRQEILAEAIHYQQFFKKIYHLSTESINKINYYKEASHPKYNKIIPASKKILTQSEIAMINLHHLELIHDLAADYKDIFTSSYLNEFLSITLNHYTKDFFNKAKELLNELIDLKVHSEIIIGGHPGFGLKLREVQLHAVSASYNTSEKNKRTNKEKADAVILLDNPVLINNSQEIINSGMIWILKSLSDFNNEVHNFLETVREMFGFYTGALNLHQKIINSGETVCFPEFIDTKKYQFSELKDIGLILKNNGPVVGNSVSFSGKNLCIITGANQGGKTTFLRSIGLAQLMAQSGLFVTAGSFLCYVFCGIYTHFPDEEDRALRTGLLEQELQRLHNLISLMSKDSLLLMNETFSTTTEYDASYLTEQITAAFRSCGLLTIFVTHLYQYAHKIYEEASDDCIFFRAGRNSDGSRTHTIEIGEPVKSSFALDLYHEILD